MSIKINTTTVIDDSRNVITPQITFTGDSTVQTTAARMPKTMVIYNASGSFTVPAGITTIYVLLVGGGQGGGEGYTGTAYTASKIGITGASAQAAFKAISVTPGNSYAFVIGAGGAGTNGNPNGTVGSDSTFNTTTVVAQGGGQGVANIADASSDIQSLLGNIIDTIGGVSYSTYNIAAQIVLRNLQTYRPGATSSTAAVVYNYGDAYYPGSGGEGEISSSSSDAAGGVGGACIIFY